MWSKDNRVLRASHVFRQVQRDFPEFDLLQRVRNTWRWSSVIKITEFGRDLLLKHVLGKLLATAFKFVTSRAWGPRQCLRFLNPIIFFFCFRSRGNDLRPRLPESSDLCLVCRKVLACCLVFRKVPRNSLFESQGESQGRTKPESSRYTTHILHCCSPVKQLEHSIRYSPLCEPCTVHAMMSPCMWICSKTQHRKLCSVQL